MESEAYMYSYIEEVIGVRGYLIPRAKAHTTGGGLFCVQIIFFKVRKAIRGGLYDNRYIKGSI